MHSPPDAEQIGGWLKTARERQGKYSQEQAAPLVGTTTRTIGGWERGETVPPADKFLGLVLLYEADLIQLLAKKSTRGAASSGAAGPGQTRRTG